MRYHLESTLPIHAFQPLGGRHSPFKHGMTLEGGGGGGDDGDHDDDRDAHESSDTTVKGMAKKKSFNKKRN